MAPLGQKTSLRQWMAHAGEGLDRAWRAAIGLALPPHCLACQQHIPGDLAALFCAGCRAALVSETWRFCGRCGSPQPTPTMGCPHCRDRGFQFDRVVPLGPYEGELRRLILQTKSPARRATARSLTHLLWDARGQELRGSGFEMVVPVPCHWKRRFWRGESGVAASAAILAGRLECPLGSRVLYRLRNTKPQWNLSPPQRLENVRGAFCFRVGYAIKDAKILLVDDILTTGATCNEAAKALLAGGAREVAVAVWARAEGRAALA